MSSIGNNGNNKDLMLSTRRELGKNEFTVDAWLHIQKLIDSVSGITRLEPSYILVADLITVYKWPYCSCHTATCLSIFDEVIDNNKVRVEDVPKFDSLMYKVMGE